MKQKGKLPSVLPNFALYGNEVRKYDVVYTSKPHIQINKNDINLPTWITTYNSVDKTYLVEIGMMFKKLFAGMKFQKKNELMLYNAKMLVSARFHAIASQKVIEVMGGYHRYKEINSRINDYAISHEMSKKDAVKEMLDELELLTRSEMNFHTRYERANSYYRSRICLPIDKRETELALWRYIRQFYNDKSENEFVRNITSHFALHYDYAYQVDRETLKKIILAHVPYDIPVEIQNADVSYVTNLIDRAFNRSNSAREYVKNMKTNAGFYKHTDEGWTFINRKLSKKQLRYRVNRCYQYLMGFFDWGYPVKEGGLPSANYQPVKESTPEVNEEGLTLPRELDDDLAKRIMKEADNNHQRHFVDHLTNEGGKHGVAIFPKFTPNTRVHKAIRELRKRNHDSGVVPKNMHRLTTDRKVFQSRKTVAGGSMMIDCSGSMGFSREDIEEIINLLPASWIAGYVGYNATKYEVNGKPYDGEVRIIADKGRMDTDALESLEYYGCNSVDFDALKELAKQPEPRIWVSDQQVIGVDENGRARTLSSDKVKEIERFVLLNNIIPIENTDMVKEMAKQLSIKK